MTACGEIILSDFYSPKLNLKSIRPGVLYYDSNGHLFIVIGVSPEKKEIKFLRTFVDWNIVSVKMDDKKSEFFKALSYKRALVLGAGFKKWRPYSHPHQSYVKASVADMQYFRNHEIKDFSLEQYDLYKANIDNDPRFLNNAVFKALFAEHRI